MEAYYHNDPRIEEWIGQISEKIFTVCLLTGVDSETEFQKGCQIVTKVTSVLLGISSFPSEYLEEALKQLLEQQLPDARVINNFPEFQNTMDRMLSEGMLKARDIQNMDVMSTLDCPKEIVQENHQQSDQESNEKNALGDLSGDFVTDSVIPALASVNITQQGILELDAELLGIEPIKTKTKELQENSQVPEQSERLKYVLKNIFPNSTIQWNKTLMGQKFLAQVEDILICLHDPERPCMVSKFNKEGWKVLVCNSVDLTFPRRLEREIKHIQHSGKKLML